MKRRIFVLAIVLGLSSTALMAQNHIANVQETQLTWLGEKVTGEHTGNIVLKSGKLEMSGKNLKSGTFEIDMTSITCTDIEDKEYNAKLVGHLKSDDFFGVDKHPVAKLEITKPVSFESGSAEVSGNLTIKEKTHPITFRVTMQETENGLRFYANITIDRTKYDVRYGSGSFFDNLGDKTIYDEFKLKIDMLVEKK